MSTFEKYKDALLNAETNDLTCCVIDLFHNGKCPDNCKVCKQKAFEWFLSGYKKPLLDEKERDYLSHVIKPFRKSVLYIFKQEKGDEADVCFIAIVLKGSERIHLPYFNTKSGMYAGMQVCVKYSLEELGL